MTDLANLGLTKEELLLHSEYLNAVEEARIGKPARYVEFQWPGIILDKFQWDIVRCTAAPEIRDIYVKGNTGCGKGCATAIAIVMYYDIWPDARVLLTSSSVEHAQRVMFAEVCKWLRRATFTPKGRVLAESVGENGEHIMKVVNPDTDEGFSGFHGVHVLFSFDEGTAVSDARYDMSYTQSKKFIVTANSRTLAGSFRLAFGRSEPDKTQTIMAQYGPRRLITVDGADCLNVREKRLSQQVGPLGGIQIGDRFYEPGERITDEDYEKVKPIIPGQTAYDEFQSLLAHPDPFRVRVFAHAQFPDEDPETQLIPSSWLEPHCEYWAKHCKSGKWADDIDEMVPVNAFGLDPSASLGGDETILACGGQKGCRELFGRKFAKTSEVGRWVLTKVEQRYGISLESGTYPIAVDCDGLGKGVSDYLTDRGVWVIEIRGNMQSEADPARYWNLRTECYGELAKRLSPDDIYADMPFAIPNDGKLKEELCASEKEFPGHDGLKFRLTPKDARGRKDVISVKDRIGRSPDRSDSLAYLYAAVRVSKETSMIAAQLDPETYQVTPGWPLIDSPLPTDDRQGRQ
jgi:hypothetical protein